MAILAHHLCDDVLTGEEIIGLLCDLKRIASKRALAIDWNNLPTWREWADRIGERDFAPPQQG